MTIIYTKPTVRNAWADTAVPTTDIVDPGNAFVTAGWLQSAIAPARQYFNWLLNWASAGIRYFMQRGIVDWDTAELYQSGAVVQQGGFVYQSLVNNNTGQNPATTPASWGPLEGYATLVNLNSYVLTTTLATDLALYAPKASPTLTGVPLTSTAATNSATGQISNGAYTVATATSIAITEAAAAVVGLAPLASPPLTGVPTAPTAAATVNNTQIASTAYVTRAVNAQLVKAGIARGLAASPGNFVPFPTAFPTACSAVVATAYGANATVLVLSFTKTGFYLINGVNGDCTWIAVGS
jgi:hypothetical protein